MILAHLPIGLFHGRIDFRSRARGQRGFRLRLFHLRRPALPHRFAEHRLRSQASHVALRTVHRQFLEGLLPGVADRFVVRAGVVPGPSLCHRFRAAVDALRGAAFRVLDLLPHQSTLVVEWAEHLATVPSRRLRPTGPEAGRPHRILRPQRSRTRGFRPRLPLDLQLEGLHVALRRRSLVRGRGLDVRSASRATRLRTHVYAVDFEPQEKEETPHGGSVGCERTANHLCG